MTAGWPLPIASEVVTLSANVSYLFEYSRKISPSAPSNEFVDQPGFPVDLRAVVGVNWTHGPFMTNVSLRYVDDYATAAGVGIGSWTTADLLVRWNAPAREGLLKNLSATLSVQNLLGTKPPFYDSFDGVGYDPTNADVLGRIVAVQLNKRW